MVNKDVTPSSALRQVLSGDESTALVLTFASEGKQNSFRVLFYKERRRLKAESLISITKKGNRLIITKGNASPVVRGRYELSAETISSEFLHDALNNPEDFHDCNNDFEVLNEAMSFQEPKEEPKSPAAVFEEEKTKLLEGVKEEMAMLSLSSMPEKEKAERRLDITAAATKRLAELKENMLKGETS
jgi:hypothetical protein